MHVQNAGITNAGAEHNTGTTDKRTCIRSYLPCGSKMKASSTMHAKYIQT